ncbi:hypothetical protein BTH42_32030 [Burkholderia sp. SRS-W-2-2016]|nr:hypothetical protein BTH42_32030 [Burkholderia sp. SRS-W-2-2016]
MRALGMLPDYQPLQREPTLPYGDVNGPSQLQPPQQPDLSAWSWDAYKTARAFDGKDYEYRRDVWSDYVGKVLPQLARMTGDDPATLQSYFHQQYAHDQPVAPKRSLYQTASDTGMTAAKGVISTAKSISDLFSPTSAASQYFGQGLRDIDRAYSPVIADEMLRRERLIAEDKAAGGSGIGPTLQYMYRNPLQTGAEAAGMIAPFVVPGGAARMAAYLPMAAETAAGIAGAAPRAAALANMALGGAAGAGQVRGNVWDQISAIPDAELMTRSPEYAQLRRTMSEPDAKAAIGANLSRNLPEVLAAGALGAAGGVVGAEGALAGLPSRFGRTGTALAEAGSQAAQAGATQFATNYGLQRALPQQSLTADVGTAAAQGGIFGALTGAAVGGHRPAEAPAPLPDEAPPASIPLLPAPAAEPDPTVAAETGTGGADSPARPGANFRMRGRTAEDISADVQAAIATLPTIYNRDYVARHLESDLRNGTLEDTARQQNSLGRAAQALMQRLQLRTERQTATRALEGPQAVPALPSPQADAPGRGFTVDTSGVARPRTYAEETAARAAQAEALQTGLTSDVRLAQQRRSDVPVESHPQPPPAEPAPAESVEPEAPPASTTPDAPAVSAPEAPQSPLPDTAVLQNRDRSTAAAIQQMNRIAADPDPSRLSFSRDFANGAPVVEANPALDIPADQLGREDISVAADGRRIPVQYAVVDAGTLLPSNRADGTPVAGYAQGHADRLRAIAGNGRVAGIQAAYERGTTSAYRAGIAQDAPLTGIRPDVVQRMHRPVLVRIMPREHVTDDIGDVSNTSGTAALSAVEQARNDSQRLNTDTLEALEFDESGEPSPASIREFVRAMPVSEQVGMLNPDGSPTRQAVDRLMAATFQRAYDDPELVRLYAQATDPEARTVLGGMANAAGAMSRLHGAGDLDIRPVVAEAAKIAVNARRRGVKLDDFARQGDIALSPDAHRIVELFAANVRSAKRIGTTLQHVADFAYSEVSKPTEDMFGPVERASRTRVLEHVLEQSHDTARPQNLGQRAGSEPAGQDAHRQAIDRRGPADREPVEAVRPTEPRSARRTSAVTQTHAEPGPVTHEEADTAPLLTHPTPEELRSREAQQRHAQQQEQQRTEAADRRATADAQREDFRLTGSDRDADVAAAAGQRSIFDHAPTEPESAPASHAAETRVEAPHASPLTIERLTDKAIIIKGDTRAHIDRIKEVKGGIWNRKHSGWIFSAKREPVIREQLADLLGATTGDRTTAVDMERNRESGPAQNRMGAQDVRGDAEPGRERTGQTGREDDGRRNTEQGHRRVSDRAPPVDRAQGDSSLRERSERPHAGEHAAGTDRSERSGTPDDEAVQPERHRSEDVVRTAGEGNRDLAQRIAEQKHADQHIPVHVGDLSNIRETLPVLLPEQQVDVAKAERRFHNDGQPGILFTNGTGTGKTYTGLGIAKRFARRGKSNLLFLAPTDAKVKDWIKDGANLNLHIDQLDSTTTAGHGMVATTYANFGQNHALVHRDWDLIVADESHYLMSNEQGAYTDALHRLRELTNHPDALLMKAQAYFREEGDTLREARRARVDELTAQGMRKPAAESQVDKEFSDRQAAYNRKVDAKYEQIRGDPMKNVVFLSATPFPYHKNLDAANGYVWPAWKNNTSGGPSERDRFYIDNLGYKWRYHRLETPDAEVNQSYLERELHRRMVESGAVSGRKLELDQDYSRDFVELETNVGRRIDDALNAILDWQGQYGMLRQFIGGRFDYHAKNRLLENLKARDAVERAKKHLALGRKVVVFHGYKTGHTDNPFIFPSTRPPEIRGELAGPGEPSRDPDTQWRDEVKRFKAQFPDVSRMDFNRLGNPIDAFTTAFGDRLALFNGDVPKGQRYRNIKAFNDDVGGKDVILVQMKAGKEGISLHDTTGKKQRVLMALPLPTSPTDAIQMEGRIYRTGNQSNAPVEYLKAGLNFEQATFANTIAQRTRTAENLALGHGARDMERAFKDGYINSSSFEPHLGQGVGGKTADRMIEQMSPFRKAETLYFAKQKERGRRDQRAGTDWYATPEPVGLKMVEWAGLRPGEKALEPSAGDGAIARFFPENTTNTFIEPSSALQSRLALNAPGDIKATRFEDHHIGNKYDGIVMNPPFGLGGKTAIEHVTKAISHLRDGGRIVALIPEGSTADRRFEQMMESDAAKHVYSVADVSLPQSVFERAGTSVKSRVVVLEKQTNPERASLLHQRNIDLSGGGDIKDLFRRIEDVQMPSRLPVEEEGRAAEDAQFSRTDARQASPSFAMSAADVRDAIRDDPASAHIDVYPSIALAPEHIRAQAAAEVGGRVEGFYDPRTGRVALIAENIATPERAREVARHELVGHYGLENMVGTDAMQTLARKVTLAEKAGNRSLRDLGAEVDVLQPGLSPERRAREMIALMAERNMQNSFTRRVLGAVRTFLTRIGLVRSDTTDAQIAGLLRDTERYLKTQGRSLTDAAPRPEAEAAFSRTAHGATSPASRTSIPLAERRETLAERLQSLRANPRRSLRDAQRVLSKGGTAPQPKWLENTVTNLFDYRNPLEQLVRRSGSTAAGRTFINTMRTFEAKTQKNIHDFEHDQVAPMMKTLAGAWNSTFKDLPWYREHGYRQFLEDIGTMGNLVKHGRERNAVIAEKTQGQDLAGSGRTNQQIAAITRDLAREAPGLESFYEKLYRDHLKPILEQRDNTLRAAGLLTPEMEAARPNYRWYVPLTGDPNETEDALSRSSAVSLKSPRAKEATGREGTLSQNVLHNVLERTDVAIRQAGMQDFKRDFVRLMEQSPAAKGLASARVNDGSTNEIFEKYIGEDGFIHRRVKASAGMSPDALVLHDGNRTTVVDVGNQKILEALNGANKADIDGVFALPDRATRLLSGIYTRYNPMFPLMNKIRDTQSQLSLIMADAPVSDKLAAVRRAAANNVTFSTQWRDKPDSVYHQWREKYEKLGGATMYSDLFRDETMRNIENEFAKTAGATPAHRTKAAAEKIGDFIDHVNEHMEMTSRVALFKALVDSGMSERDAALYTKNTMNFETKGKYGRQLGALYTFAGPALFDARRMAQSLRSPRGAAVLVAQFAMMYGLYGAMKAMSGDDDDGIARLDKVPLSQTGRFLTLLDPNNPDGKGWKFPVGFGYGRIALTLAAALHRYADGVDDGATFAGNVGKEALMSNFSPLEPVDIDPTRDVSGWAMQQFTPALMKPLLQLAMNQNAQGSPIHKPDEWTGSKLHFGESWPATSAIFKGAAKSLFDATGIDVYPETLQFLLRSYGGNGTMDAIRATQLLGEKADTEWTLGDIPGAQTFASKVINQDTVDFRQNYADLQKLVAERKYAQENDTLQRFDTSHPNVEQGLAIYQAANSEVKTLFKERREAERIEDAAQRQQAVRDLNRQLRVIQMTANHAYREAQQ